MTAPSEIVRVATRGPFAVGVKVISTEQLEPAVNVDPQVVVWTAKSPAFVPVGLMLEIARVPGR